MKRFLKGFVYAARGIIHTVCRERNFRFHLCAAAFVSWFAANFYELSRAEWAVLLLTFALVLSLEAVNTALERLSDRVSAQHDSLIKQCKDCAAGAVLIAAVFSVGVGAVLFWDAERFGGILRYFCAEVWRIPVLAGAIAAGVAFVWLPEWKRKKS